MRSIETSNIFISQSLRICKSQGFLTFIIPNNLLYQDESIKTRKLIVNNNTLLGVIDLGENIFNATVPSCIFWLTKREAKNYDFIFVNLMQFIND